MKPSKVLIGSDSSSALTSFKSMQSKARQDVLLEIAQAVFRIERAGILVKFIWIPAHIGVEGSKLANKYALVATKK